MKIQIDKPGQGASVPVAPRCPFEGPFDGQGVSVPLSLSVSTSVTLFGGVFEGPPVPA